MVKINILKEFTGFSKFTLYCKTNRITLTGNNKSDIKKYLLDFLKCEKSWVATSCTKLDISL